MLFQILTDPWIILWLGIILLGLYVRKRNDDDF